MEKAFLEEKRKEALLEMGATNNINFTTYEKRNEVILFNDNTANTQLFYFEPKSTTEDFFGNVKMTPRLAYDDMKL